MALDSTEVEDKVRAMGKKPINDVTESVDVVSLIIRAGKELLEKHDRECQLPWSSAWVADLDPEKGETQLS